VTYALIVAPFALLTLLVVLATLRRPGFGRRMAASGISAAVLVVLTAVFDNLRVGLAPIEDFSYAVCAAFLVPAVFVLLAPRRPVEAPA
jgi:hypothetical protein